MKVNDLFRSKKSLAAADLRDEAGKARSIRVTIEAVTTQKFDDSGIKPVLHFVGKEKVFTCNRTNALRIIEALGTDDSDLWIGASITLYPTMVDGPKGRVDAIRVDDRPGATRPPAKPAPRVVEPPAPPEDDPGDGYDMPPVDDIEF